MYYMYALEVLVLVRIGPKSILTASFHVYGFEFAMVPVGGENSHLADACTNC